MTRPTKRVLLALAAAATLTGCAPGSMPALGQPAPSTTAIGEPVSGDRLQLARVPVRAIPGRDRTYQRDAFGDAWSDAGIGIALARNGCDTRNDILRRDARPGTLRTKAGTRGCKVTAGTWVSPYTGATFTVSRQLDIDHVVPLGRAWASGARSWSPQQRLNFANDPDNLVAVDARSNRSKGDSGPSTWRPKRAGQCQYAIRYLRPVVKYGLPITSADAKALSQMLDTCPEGERT